MKPSSSSRKMSDSYDWWLQTTHFLGEVVQHMEEPDINEDDELFFLLLLLDCLQIFKAICTVWFMVCGTLIKHGWKKSKRWRWKLIFPAHYGHRTQTFLCVIP